MTCYPHAAQQSMKLLRFDHSKIVMNNINQAVMRGHRPRKSEQRRRIQDIRRWWEWVARGEQRRWPRSLASATRAKPSAIFPMLLALFPRNVNLGCQFYKT